MSIRTEDMAGMDFSDLADVAAGKLAPIHPGKILREDFLLPLGITQYRLAKEIGVSQRRIASLDGVQKAVNRLVPVGTIMAYGGDITDSPPDYDQTITTWLGHISSDTNPWDIIPVVLHGALSLRPGDRKGV
jgi:hypothetical protein